jgi:hypothetical protein
MSSPDLLGLIALSPLSPPALTAACRRRPARIQGCRKAGCGFRRFSGSHVRHLAMKSRNNSSSHFRIAASVLAPGRCRLPLALTNGRGAQLASKNNLRLDAFSTIYRSGTPKTSMMQASCSCSFSPGKIGTPVYSSARMQPSDHMSMAIA